MKPRLGTLFWILVVAALARGGWHLWQRSGGSADERWAGGVAGGDGPPTLVVITFDALRADRLAMGGSPLVVMPALDGLSAGSIVLAEHFAASSGTNASLASLFTGRLPSEHGVTSLHRLGRTALPESELTLAEALRAAGWRTLAFCAVGSLAPEISGLDQGLSLIHI